MNEIEQLKKLRQEYISQNNLIEEVKVLEKLVNLIDKESDEYILILNEYAGTIKYIGEYDKGIKRADEALEIISKKYGKNTVMYATSLLNKTDILRFKKDFNDLEKNYLEVIRIYEENGMHKNYEYAGVCNNLALYYQNTEQFEKALSYHNISLSLLKTMPNHRVEYATTLNNLVEPLKKLNQREKALESLNQALKIYEEKLGLFHSSYASALNNLAIFKLEENLLDESLQLFKKCLRIVSKTTGVNSLSYNTIKENVDILEEKLQKNLTPESKGLDIAYGLYKEHILNNLDDDLLNNVAIGLFGQGSECLDLDDLTSKDHDFSPMPVILAYTDDAYEKMKIVLNKLPKEYLGYSLELTGANLERRGLFKYEDYVLNKLQTLNITKFEELTISPQVLLEFTNGKIFTDKKGILENLRNRLMYYSTDVNKNILANLSFKMYQSGQYNLPRVIERKDYFAARLCLNEFCNNLMHFVFCLNKEYFPYYKHRSKILSDLPLLGKEIKERIDSLYAMKLDNKNMVENKIFEIVFILLKEARKQYPLYLDSLFLVDFVPLFMQDISDELVLSFSPWRVV